MKTIKFFTLGCKVNQYETQSLREQFLARGFKELSDGLPADICIINTCTVTHHADSGSLNIIRRAIRRNPGAKVIVTGCLTELDWEKIKAIKGVSYIVKNKDKENIASRLSRQFRHNELNDPTSTTNRGISHFFGHTRAFLKIQDGCENFCSYCKVPLVRGSYHSQPIEKIFQEAKNLVKNGFKEIVLCGICLGAYGKDLAMDVDIADVIQRLQEIDGLLRIRLSSIEPKYITDSLINMMAESKKICRHLHIPLQSGDDGVLEKMKRKYCAQDYLELIQKIKQRIPDIAITTDVMVGFPAETEDNFRNTVKLIKKIMPLKVHIFSYSARQGTLAFAKFRQNLDAKIAKERFAYLEKVAEGLSLKYKKRFLNRKLAVLVEGKAKSNAGFWQGYTDNYLKVLFKSRSNFKNKLVVVKLKEIEEDYILGEV
jgi:threonylcarbamoyladenosine tRNA methylthiotransferase MtaB